MRKYLIRYWKEYNDEPTDFEMVIEAYNFDEAYRIFKDTKRGIKRITLIKEI